MNVKTREIADEIGAEIEALLSSGKPLSDPGKGLCLKTPGKLSVKAGTLSSRADLPVGYTREQAIEQAATLLGAGKVTARNEIAKGDDDAIQASHSSTTMSDATRQDRVTAIARIARLLPNNERTFAIDAFKMAAATALSVVTAEESSTGLSPEMAQKRKAIADKRLLAIQDSIPEDAAELLASGIESCDWTDEEQGDKILSMIAIAEKNAKATV